MNFDLQRSIEILEKTPFVLTKLLAGLSPFWTASSGDAGRWEAYDVVGHLIHGEDTDWIPRAEIILGDGDRTFVPFDRLAQFEASGGRTLDELLNEFAAKRRESIAKLKSWNIDAGKLSRKGVHPELGEVTLEQLLATWVVHDLNHIRQMVTAMAAKYANDVGPWRQYLSVLQAPATGSSEGADLRSSNSTE